MLNQLLNKMKGMFPQMMISLMAVGLVFSKTMVHTQCFWFYYEEDMDDAMKAELARFQ